MYPQLIQIGPITIYTYGFLMVIAYLSALLLALKRAERYDIKKEHILDLFFWVLIGSILGARLMLLWVIRDEISWNVKDVLDVILHSNGVFYGGFIGALVFGYVVLKKYKLSLGAVADLAAPSIALGQAIGRLGCFSAGCCFGKPTGVPWAIRFTNELAHRLMGTPLNIRIHPTQLYESVSMFILTGFLIVLARREPVRGVVWWAYVTAYACIRFIIEFFRGDPRGQWWIFSTSQWVSIFFFIAALIWWFVYYPRMKKEKTA